MIKKQLKNKQMKNMLLLLISLFVFTNLNGQVVILNEEPSITALMEKFIDWNAEKDWVDGWRIQIINTDDRRTMERTLASFKSRYPNIRNVHWEQVSPYYRIKVGAFRSKLKAQALLNDVRSHYPSAIIVWEKIKKSELITK